MSNHILNILKNIPLENVCSLDWILERSKNGLKYTIKAHNKNNIDSYIHA